MAFEERYYREELDYIRQLGKLMAQKNPYLSRFVAEKEGEPDVERLLESFAFLSGGLRQKLEDAFPEFTRGIIQMLWPNYLRPVPAMTVIEYRPKNKLKFPVKVNRDELIRNRTSHGALSPEQGALAETYALSVPVCHFTLARDIWLQPLRLRNVRNSSSLKKGVIDIDFSTPANTTPQALDLNKITFWLDNEDEYTRHQLYLWFCEHLMDAELIAGERHIPLPDLWLDAAGFEQDDALLPWPTKVHSGYRILQEYFCYPESFYFFHLRNAAPLPDDFPTEAFTLRLHFNRPLSQNTKLCANSLRMFCTPAINLFTHDAEPVRPDGVSMQYPLCASHAFSKDYEIFCVKTVTSNISGTEDMPISDNNIHFWPELAGFNHAVEYSGQHEVIYWHHQSRSSLLHRGLDHSISLVHSDGSLPEPSRVADKVLTPSLICTNRMQPAVLHIGDICIPVNKNPAVADFSNVTCPSRPLSTVPDGEMHWSLISCMNLNYLSLLDREALFQILRTFDLPGIHHSHQARLSEKKLEAIEKIDTRPIDRLFKGIPVRGLMTTLWINPAPFICEGEIYLLSTVLSRFFALYASIHSFHCLKVINTESQETWEWQNNGQHALM